MTVDAAFVVPSLWRGDGWIVTTRSDPTVRALRDRHYSTKRPGGRTVGPPGRVVVLRTADGLAGWITHYPDPQLVLDGLDALRCTLFRNEGPRLSSELVLEAERISEATLGAPPDGWVTYVEPGKVRSANPGYCFRVAGWSRDREWIGWQPGRLIRLRKEITR